MAYVNFNQLKLLNNLKKFIEKTNGLPTVFSGKIKYLPTVSGRAANGGANGLPTVVWPLSEML